MPVRDTPHLTSRAQAEAEARKVREAEALRENLRRRKAQARSRMDDLQPAPNSTQAGRDETR